MDGEAFLSNIEREIFLSYGSEGVQIFRLANKKLTINEIAKQLNLSEERVYEIVENMKGKYIYLEEPELKRAEIGEIKMKEMTYVDIPKKVDLDNITSIALVSELTFKFGPTARRIYEMIDGKNDVLELAAENLISLAYVDNLMWVLAEKRSVTFRRMQIEDIKKKYGSIGFKIFNQYGREGLYLYLLLDKTADPFSAIRYSEIDPSVAVEMMDYIINAIDAPITFSKKDALSLLKR
ncbi:MAG: hypothetical protein NZ903_02690 [Candidatus Micrarchaeota archaeon]|nr:hypothetical protein [Candidatus Micrarchaeota archaeon]